MFAKEREAEKLRIFERDPIELDEVERKLKQVEREAEDRIKSF